MSLAYRTCGVRVETEARFGTHLPLSQPDDDRGGVIRFRMATGPAPQRPSEWVFHQPWLAVGRVGDGYLLRFHEHADFLVDAAGSEVVCEPVDGCPAETIEQLLIDQVLPQVLHLRGQFCFHASAVATHDGAVAAFLGEAGSGKSTLAASMARHASIVSDDCLAVSISRERSERRGEAEGRAENLIEGDRLVVHPSHASARLWSDSAASLFENAASLPRASPRTEKVRVDLAPPTGALELRRVYLLERSDAEPAISSIAKRDAVVQLANNLHRLDPGDRRRMAEELPFLERVVRHVEVARLAYRHCFDELPRVHRAILSDLER